MRKVVLPEQRHDFPQAVAVLGRHQPGTLVGKRIMQTDSQMTFTLVQETFQPLCAVRTVDTVMRLGLQA